MADVSGIHLLIDEEEEDDDEEEEEAFSVPCWFNDLDDDDIYGSDSDPFSSHLSDFLPSEQSSHASVAIDGEDLDELEACLPIVEADGSDSEDPFSLDLSEFLPSEQSGHAQIVTDEEDVDELEACLPIVEIDSSDSDFDSDSVIDVDFLNREDRVNFVIDLFGNHVEKSHVIDKNDSNPFSERLGYTNLSVFEGNDELGLGLDLDRHSEEDQNSEFMIEDCGGEFFTKRGSVSESGESSTLHAGGESFGEGLRVIGIGSDSDDEDEGVLGNDLNAEEDDGLDQAPDDLSLRLYWDCLHLEDRRDTNEDFEWEEVDDELDEGEVLSMVIDADEDRSISTEFHSEEEASQGEEAAMRNLEWEFLLTVNSLERNMESVPDTEFYMADHDDDIYTAEYEMLFGQFAETESYMMCSPPAAKSVVENLPFIFLTQLDVENNNVICAVCKDEISMKEPAKRLPCIHHYHADCIIPWLSIRNTCPVCRYELPTDDPDYERRRTRQAGHLPGNFQIVLEGRREESISSSVMEML